ncbi:phosphate acyltransferase [Labilibaculum manganireducens]|uniref:phosphate acyltransferase n=1 Tax=Labilibaculum manganireducens TaxID=1940525 RepID=UPI0029F572AE|nr:phosphate acyltransferase [Labilibaculum manganireducens]
MSPIRSLDQMVEYLRESGKKKKIAVAYAQDPNTIGAIAKAISEGFVEAVMIGDEAEIRNKAKEEGINPDVFTIVHIPNDVAATSEAVRMARADEVDVVMKGLVGTDKFLKAVLNKEHGLLPSKAVMSYVCALDLPKYDKLLFVSDTAVLPFPDLNQKIAMVNYSVKMARKFGIEKPKVALISATEKPNTAFPSSIDDTIICKMADRGQIKDCIVDGPLDVFLACDPASVEIKGIATPIKGEADCLVFPSLEACNSFYKGLMLFAGGELAGLIQGTTKPVVVMSRSESEKSKYYCIALSVLMAD